MSVLSVWEVTRYLKQLVQSDGILGELAVRGEVSNFTRSAAGHCYFTLKDGRSQISCALFAGRAARVAAAVRDGSQAVVYGRLDVYERAGQYQIIVEDVKPEGQGACYLEFLRLKEKLEREGLFDPARRRRLPPFPRVVGIVTSPKGAVLHDMVTIMRRRWPLVQILVAPSLVQGVEAPAQLVRGLALLSALAEVEVIVLGRGGGSFEELHGFNDEALARAIAASPVPVVSAVGHETDFTIADFVADLRAATPTAAAQAMTPDIDELLRTIEGTHARLARALRHSVSLLKARFRAAHGHPALRYPERLLQEPRQALDSLQGALASTMERRAVEARRAFVTLQSSLAAANERRIEGVRRALHLYSARLDGLSPHNVLARGYALLRRVDGALVTSCDGAAPGGSIEALLRDGSLACTVDTVTPGAPINLL